MSSKRNFLLVAGIVVAVAVLITLIRTQTTLAEKGVAWRYNLTEASKEASKAKKPMMVDFYADWCGWCKKLDGDVYSNDKVIAASRKFISVKVDTDKNNDSARKYSVRGLPTIVFLQADGKEISRIVGYRPAEEFLKEMNKALDGAKKK